MLIGISLLNRNIQKLQDDVKTDPLTKLGNRRSLEAALQKLEASSQIFSVVSIDIDHFKKVNDTFGHDAGDIVLRDLAKQMKSVSRADDLPCRVGGEEFLIVLPRTSETTAVQVAERLRKQVEAAVFEGVGHITISWVWQAGRTALPTSQRLSNTPTRCSTKPSVKEETVWLSIVNQRLRNAAGLVRVQVFLELHSAMR
jgi:diguanylate cyclase (GGDEF)-like protein